MTPASAIIAAVCEMHGCTPHELRSHSRMGHLRSAREITVGAIKDICGTPVNHIPPLIGRLHNEAAYNAYYKWRRRPEAERAAILARIKGETSADPRFAALCRTFRRLLNDYNELARECRRLREAGAGRARMEAA